MTAYLLVALMAMPGPLLWALSTEAIVVYQVHAGLDPLGLAASAALGQVGTFLILYALGEKGLRRIRWFDERLNRLDDRARERMRRSTTGALVSGGLVGLPPVIAMAPFCGTVFYPRLRMSAIVFITRMVRFSVLTLGGQQVLAWFGL
ncbi:MAG: hypothetical protein HY904_10440 [Deltaproteobacteria bacterium]|nr:hypothetical protein [Deltaproteobacteria bacterium]